ncbi:MAG: hypothetical protein OXU22_06765, partial [Gammaproteobacteria bacterium]|nr:hypothetical protein [Gammaproteobacteria bacterium]
PASPATLWFKVTVTDAVTGARSVARVTVTVREPPLPAPAVDAGSDQSVAEGATVTLTATVTRGQGDVDSDLAYAWTQVPAADDATALSHSDADYAGQLSGAATATATFTAPAQVTRKTYYFRLAVTASRSGRSAATAADTIAVTVNDASAPVITEITADFDAHDTDTGDSVTAVVTNPDGDAVTYRWAQTAPEPSAPGAPAIILAGAATGTATLTYPDLPTRTAQAFTLTFTATDTAGLMAADTVTITLRDATKPTAVLASTLTAVAGATVTLDASASRRAGGGQPDDATGMTFAWRQVEGASSDTAVRSGAVPLSSTTAVAPTFTAPSTAATLYFLLIVTDTVTTATATARTTVTVAQEPTAAVYGVDFAVAPATIAEGASATFTVELSGAPAFTGNIEVVWGFSAGETAAADFSGATAPAGGTLTFTHASRSRTVTITTAADDLAEGGADGAETFSLTLSAAASLDSARRSALGGVQLGAAHQVDITDDDELSVAIARKMGQSGAIGEAGGTATFTVSLGGATSTADVTVSVAVSTTSAGAGDYTVNPPGALLFSSGVRSTEVTVTASADALLEGDETFTVTLSGAAGGGGVPPAITTGTSPEVTITDADTAMFSIMRTDDDGFTEDAAGGAGSALLEVIVSGGQLSADVVVEITARRSRTGRTVVLTLPIRPGSASDSDNDATTASGFILVEGRKNNLNEADETVTVTLTGARGSGLTSASGSAEVVMEDDDDIRVAITRAGDNPPASVDEDAGEVEFTVALDGGLRTTAVTMPFTVGGTGITAGDYDISGPGNAPAATATGHVVNFAADGSETATDTMTIVIAITDDALNEAAEKLTVTGTAAGGGGLRVASGGGAIAYTDDGVEASVGVNPSDALTVAVAPVNAHVSEGGNARFTVTLSAASAADATVVFAAAMVSQTGTANLPDNPDFTLSTPSASPLVITAGQTEGTVAIAVNIDRLAEDAETLRLTVGSVTLGGGGGAVGTTFPLTAEATIMPNAAALYGVGFAATAPGVVVEGAAATFAVELSGGREFSGAIEVVWGFSPGETAAADFSGATAPAGGTLTFTHASRSRTVTITTAADDLAEGGADGAETFSLTLSAAASLDSARRSALGGVQLGAAHQVDITDDDELSVAIARKMGQSGAIGEAGGTATFTVSLGGATSTADVTVSVAVSTTSAGAGDYTVNPPGALLFSSGVRSTEVTVTATADTLLEGDETFSVTLSDAGGGGGRAPTLSPAPSPRVTITDAETATIAIARDADADGFTEDAAGTAGSTVFTVTLSGGELSEAVDLTFTVSGGHSTSPGLADGLTIAPRAGMQSATGAITVTAAADNLNEPAETVTVTLTGASGSGLTSASGSATAMLADDDAITYSIAGAGGSGPVSEGEAVDFTITLAGGRLPGNARVVASVRGQVDVTDYDITAPGRVSRASNGAIVMVNATTATAGAQTATATFTVAISDDDVNEADEDLTVAIGVPTVVGAGALIAGARSHTVTIGQNDPLTVSLARTTPSGSGEVTEGTAVTFTVTLSRDSAGAVAVPLTVVMGTQAHLAGQGANTAMLPDLSASGITPTVAGGITTLSGQLGIAAGSFERSARLVITAANDGLAEGDESFTVSLGTPVGGAESGPVSLGSPASVTVGIDQNAAAAHEVSVQGPDAAVVEGGDALFTFRLPALTGANARTAGLTVNYIVGGDVSAGDYTAPGGSVTFAPSGAGATSQTVTIATTDDNLNEAAEDLIVTLTTVDNAASHPGGASASGSATATLNDNDAITYSVSDAPAVSEGDPGGGAVRLFFEVQLSGASAGDVTVPFTLGGSASGGGDYTEPSPLSVTIAAGAANNRATIGIPIVADNLNEDDETVTVTLADESAAGFSQGAAAGVITRAGAMAEYTATGTIEDDDAITVTIANAGSDADGDTAGFQVAEGADATFTVTLGGAGGGSSTEVTVAYSVSGEVEA